MRFKFSLDPSTLDALGRLMESSDKYPAGAVLVIAATGPPAAEGTPPSRDAMIKPAVGRKNHKRNGHRPAGKLLDTLYLYVHAHRVAGA